MDRTNRRRFLSNVGGGMIMASIGSSLATDLGLAPLRAEEPLRTGDEAAGLSFGELEPLVDFLQATPPDKMLPLAVAKIQAGTPLETLVAAAALANARAFGGEDYVGFHTLMALVPALAMTELYPGIGSHVPVLKVLYRNSSRLQEVGGSEARALEPVSASAPPSGVESGELLRRLVREQNREGAEATFAGIAQSSPQRALNDLLVAVEDGAEVHRVVLVHRAYEMVPLVGADRAHTMLRQSLRYCLKNEAYASNGFRELRSLLPELLDQYHLLGRDPGDRTMSDSELSSFTEMLFQASADQAAEAVAGALADNFSPATLAEAISLAANQLVLRDAGRTGKQVQAGKPEGSVHGDSIGVHACDSANAWRNIARHGDRRHAMAATILAGYQVALDRVQRGGDFEHWKPRPLADVLTQVTNKQKCHLLGELNDAIRSNHQELACAVTQRYLDCKHGAGNLFGLFKRYAITEDGALHAEKYFHTVREEYHVTRPEFRDRQLVALARVTASEYGRPAAGVAQACELLGLNPTSLMS
jgi:hypothetical protein